MKPLRQKAVCLATTACLLVLATAAGAAAGVAPPSDAGGSASVTGAGWRGNVHNPTTPITHFVVSARSGPQGVAGTFISMNTANALLNFNARVTCLNIVGDHAIVGGVVTGGGEPGQIGTGFAIGFVDSASPGADAVTFSDVFLTQPVDCAAETGLFTLMTFPVLDGNVVIDAGGN